jgi:hypothetical protein
MKFEHRDITPERRPEHAGQKTKERIKTYLFFDLMKEALINYDDFRKGKLRLPKSEVHNIEFFFKKLWDKFTEPLLEYPQLMEEIETKQWESKGAKSRALRALKERFDKSLAGLREVITDTDLGVMDNEKRKRALARIYEGYAAYINENKTGFENLAEIVGKGFDSELRAILGVYRPRPESRV